MLESTHIVTKNWSAFKVVLEMGRKHLDLRKEQVYRSKRNTYLCTGSDATSHQRNKELLPMASTATNSTQPEAASPQF